MCLASAGRVIAVESEGARVDLDGRARRAACWLLPDVAPGDWVEVAAGTILRRLTAAEATELNAIRRALAGEGELA